MLATSAGRQGGSNLASVSDGGNADRVSITADEKVEGESNEAG
jgi:hypothetical protein